MFLRSLKFRIALLFLILFISGAAILYSTSYLFFARSLKNDFNNEMRFLLLNFWAQYQSGGLEFLSQELVRNKYEGKAFLIRIADRTNITLFLLYPELWDNFNFNSLDRIKPANNGNGIILKTPEYSWNIEIKTVLLPDSNILQVGISNEDTIKILKHFRGIFLLALLPVLLISFAGFFLFAAGALKPLDKVIDTADNIIKTGKIKTRIPYKDSGDEISKLINTFNTMLNSIDSSMERMKNTLDNVAHDLRTPMTRLQGTAEIAMATARNSEMYREALQECVDDTRTIMTLVNTLMDISEAETGIMKLRKSSADISLLVRDVAEFYYYPADEKGIIITTDILRNISAEIDINRIRQVLANILDNAVKYTPENGEINVSLYRKTINGTPHICIRISDNGPGIPEQDIEHIWNRLYRADNTRNIKGLGLGLSLAKAIVEAHNGSIKAENRKNHGTVFTISLPVR